jgi:signal transduction histidine kinase
VRTQAQAQADLIAATAADLLGSSHRRELGTLARTAATSLRGRVLIVDRAGDVLVDSGTPPQIGVSYESRPEIESALEGRQVQTERASKTLGREILATAVPIIRDGRSAGAVRVTQSIAAVNSAVRHAELGLVLIGAIVLALGLSAGAVIAAQVAPPLRRLEEVARRVAHGDLTARAKLEGSREQRSLSQSFNEMTGRIARLLGAQREFVADASHQLRTPLAALRLRLEEAKALSRGGAEARELDAAIAEVDRLAHTVDELLVLSRAGERQAVGGSVDLSEVAASALLRWSGTAETSSITLEHQAQPGVAPAWAALPDLERALDALVENALAYSPAGSTVSIVSGPGRIEVRDRGPGVEPDEREAVFERFHRGRSGLSGAPGSGLGLPIARELSHGWGGEVLLEPRAGGGTVAIVAVPGPAAGDAVLPSVNSALSTVSR